MRFQVPQFIEIEDKVVGPLSFRQFIYLLGGGGLSFIIYNFVPLLLAIPLIAAVIAFSLGLSFYRFNNKPFVFLVEAFLKYIMAGKLYIWKKEARKPEANTIAEQEANEVPTYIPRLSDSKLRELSWSLDVHDPENPL